MSTVIVGFARTPFAKFNGRFHTVSSTRLGAHAISGALPHGGTLPKEAP